MMYYSKCLIYLYIMIYICEIEMYGREATLHNATMKKAHVKIYESPIL